MSVQQYEQFTVKTTAAEAVVIIREHIAAQTLIAYNESAERGYYATQDAETGKSCFCAIGCLYPTEVAHYLEQADGDNNPLVPFTQGNYMLAGDLIEAGLLDVPEHEVDWFRNLQQYHDTAANHPTVENLGWDRFERHLDALPVPTSASA